MLELLQATIDVLPAQSEWAWLASATDSEMKWGVIGYLGSKAHDVCKDYVAAWRDVRRTEAES